MVNVKDGIKGSFASPPSDSPSSTFAASPSLTSPPSTSSAPPSNWTRQDYLLTVIALLTILGDGVEMYLPGVITQKVACELGVSQIQEGILAVVFNITCSIAVTSSSPILKRFGEKITLLASLYLSIMFVVICAVVPNYYTLVASRALTGICVGLNVCTVGIYQVKHISTKEILHHSLFISEGVAAPIGGAWVSFLGWLILDSVGWRIFVLLTSIPLFVPPILILHMFMIEKQEDCSEDRVSVKCSEANDTDKTEYVRLMKNKDNSVPNFYTRVIKSSLFAFCSFAIGHGMIILVPWIFRSFKNKGVDEEEVNKLKCTDHTVHGNDFLVLTVVNGVVNVIGRVVGYFLWKRVKFLILQSTVAATIAMCFAIILATDNYIATVILLAVAKFCYSVQVMEITMIYFDYDYFGKSGLESGGVVTAAIGEFGGAAGIALSAFLHPHYGVMATLGIACFELLIICSMKERF